MGFSISDECLSDEACTPASPCFRVTRKTHRGPIFCWILSSKYTDEETGLIYFGYRFYAPEIGRWASRDPIDEKGGRNLFRFVNNRPVCSLDLLGLDMMGPFDMFPYMEYPTTPPPPDPPPDTGTWSFSPPPLTFTFGQSVSFAGWVPVGGPVWIGGSGGWKVKIGSCSKDGTTHAYTKVEANANLMIQLNIVGAAPGWFSYTKPVVENLACCPAENLSAKWNVKFQAKLGPAVGECTYSAPFKGGSGSWACTGSMSFSSFSGVSVAGGGGVTGTWVEVL